MKRTIIHIGLDVDNRQSVPWFGLQPGHGPENRRYDYHIKSSAQFFWLMRLSV